MIVELGFSVGVHLTKGSFAPGLAAAGASVRDEEVGGVLDGAGVATSEGEDDGAGDCVVDEVAGADAGDSGGVVVDPLGAPRWPGSSVGAAADGVVVALGVGVGDVVG